MVDDAFERIETQNDTTAGRPERTVGSRRHLGQPFPPGCYVGKLSRPFTSPRISVSVAT